MDPFSFASLNMALGHFSAPTFFQTKNTPLHPKNLLLSPFPPNLLTRGARPFPSFVPFPSSTFFLAEKKQHFFPFFNLGWSTPFVTVYFVAGTPHG